MIVGYRPLPMCKGMGMHYWQSILCDGACVKYQLKYMGRGGVGVHYKLKG